MNIKRTLRKVINRDQMTVKRTELELTLNYIIELEHEIQRLARSKGITVEITVEDR